MKRTTVDVRRQHNPRSIPLIIYISCRMPWARSSLLPSPHHVIRLHVLSSVQRERSERMIGDG